MELGNSNGVNGVEMLDIIEAKIREDRFVIRLRENLAAADNAGGVQEGDNLAELRKLTGGKLLRSELEAKYPLAKSLSVRVTPKAGLFGKEEQAIVLTGKVIVRLDRFVEVGGDDEAISLGELNSILSKESDLAGRSQYKSVLGLYSPTGWADDAKKFVENNPPGSGWASNRVYPILIGPEITELVWDKKSDKLANYISVFCGLTLEERSRICKDEIQRAVLVQDFANLQRIAEAKGFDIGFVKHIAKGLCSDNKELKLTTVKDVGLVLKRRI